MTSGRVLCAAGMHESDETPRAVREAWDEAIEQLGTAPDLVVVFFSAHHEASAVRDELATRVGKGVLLGVCGESIVGTGVEVERSSAISIWMATLPDVDLRAFHLDYSSEIDQGSFLGWTEDLLEEWPGESVVILFGEPFTFPADRFAALLNEEHRGVPLVGGMASGADEPGKEQIILGERVYSSGAVGVRLAGNCLARTVVSQGCRPVGQPFVITRAERNIIFELGGKPALAQLQSIIESMSEEDREKAAGGLHVGRVIDEYKGSFSRGDFLVRNIIGIDQRSGAIAIGDYVRAGQTVQFHIRDAQSADEDLSRLLSEAAAEGRPAGALLFSCNGRGTRLFTAADHDAGAVAKSMGEMPLAGFFAAGELGPVAGKNFLHGFTASLLLFGKADA